MPKKPQRMSRAYFQTTIFLSRAKSFRLKHLVAYNPEEKMYGTPIVQIEFYTMVVRSADCS